MTRPEKDQEANNWSIFSIVQWYSGNKSLARNVFEKLDEYKNNEIAVQINQETYFPTEFDFMLLAYHYKIPLFIKMKGNQKINFSAMAKMVNILPNPDFSYVLLAKKILKENSYIYSLIKHSSTGFKLDKTIFNQNINLDSSIDINNYIGISIKHLEEKEKKKKKSDNQSKLKKRKKIKKIGKKRL